jgi:F-type H+-transporting ATPase subunit delta
MPSGSAGRRYAQAVFSIAREQNKLEQWAADLENMDSAFNHSSLRNFLDNPKTTRENKIRFIREVLGSKINPEALNLAQLLVHRNRQHAVTDVFHEYIKLWNKLRGIEIAEVTTAIPIGTTEQEAIRNRLSAITGKQITVQMKVDPEIVGGLIARIGDTLIDGSVRTRLQNLRKQLV